MQSRLGIRPGLQVTNNLVRNDCVTKAEAHDGCHADGGRHGTQRLLSFIQPEKQISRKQRTDALITPITATHNLQQARKIDVVALALEIRQRESLSRWLAVDQVPT